MFFSRQHPACPLNTHNPSPEPHLLLIFLIRSQDYFTAWHLSSCSRSFALSLFLPFPSWAPHSFQGYFVQSLSLAHAWLRSAGHRMRYAVNYLEAENEPLGQRQKGQKELEEKESP